MQLLTICQVICVKHKEANILQPCYANYHLYIYTSVNILYGIIQTKKKAATLIDRMRMLFPCRWLQNLLTICSIICAQLKEASISLSSCMIRRFFNHSILTTSSIHIRGHTHYRQLCNPKKRQQL